MVLYYRAFYLGINIGFKSLDYSFEEEDGFVSLCLELQDGILERTVSVSYEISSTEGKGIKISVVSITNSPSYSNDNSNPRT